MGNYATFVVALVALVLLVPTTGLSSGDVELVPVVRGAPPLANADVVALCPDLTERAEVFLARGEDSLASRLAKAGYRVYLVDPWAATLAASGGFDAVVSEIYPRIIDELKSRTGGGRVTWLGHGLCGFLPVAASAGGHAQVSVVDWISLATRLDWSAPSPLLLKWLRSWERGEAPVPEDNQRMLFTGLREAVGPRGSSVPASFNPDRALPAKVQLESFHRSEVARAPVLAVLRDTLRWFERGRADSATGWLDYGVGIELVGGRGLILMPSSDPLAPPESTLVARSRLSSTSEVEFRLLARSEGMAEDYGHLGLLLSRNAVADGDGIVLRWLARKRTRQ